MSENLPETVSFDSDTTIVDPLTIESRIARIEDLVTENNRILSEMETVFRDLRPAIERVQSEIMEKGAIGMIGALTSSLLSGGMGVRRQ